MKIGFCGSIDMAADIKEWGYDFVELALAPLAQLDEDEFTKALAKLADSKLPCLACNIFLPGSVRVTGPLADTEISAAYLDKALARAARLGARVIVFGSGGARSIPAGFSPAQARRQLRDFARLAAKKAAAHDLTIVMEPLNSMESNIINTVSEALLLALAVDEPNFKVLVDSYHMDLEKENLTALQMAGPDLYHVHISALLGRAIPVLSDKNNLAPFLTALKNIGYQGGISVEARDKGNLAAEAKEALQVIRSLLE